MDLRAAADAAKQQISDQFAADAPQDIRLESWLYDDHLMVWTVTVGFAPADQIARVSKVVRFSESNKLVLSVRDP